MKGDVGLEAYPTYKDSGVDWLGRIPERWTVDRLKHGFRLQRREPRINDGNVTAFRDGQVTLRVNRRIDGFTEADKEIGYQGVEPNDLVIHAMDGFAGAIGVSDSRGKCSPVYSVCLANPGVVPQYYGRAIRTIALSGYITSLAKGVRERSTDFRWADARNLQVPYPSTSEQLSITVFLDREIAKIDNLIEKQQQLTELLREKRSAVISNAVTKGLDPTVTMKDSGIEWIGNIPLSWDMKRLKDGVRTNGFIRGPFGSSLKAEYFVASGYKVYEQKNAIKDDLSIGTSYISSDKFMELRRFAVQKADILMSCSGTIGKLVRVSEGFEPGVINQALLIIRLAPSIVANYFIHLFSSREVQQLIIDNTQGGAMQNLVSQSVFKNIPLLIPPLHEQTAIVTYLDAELTKVDKLIDKSGQLIKLMRERRTALISAAVTGKIDVRKAA